MSKGILQDLHSADFTEVKDGQFLENIDLFHSRYKSHNEAGNEGEGFEDSKEDDLGSIVGDLLEFIVTKAVVETKGKEDNRANDDREAEAGEEPGGKAVFIEGEGVEATSTSDLSVEEDRESGSPEIGRPESDQG